MLAILSHHKAVNTYMKIKTTIVNGILLILRIATTSYRPTNSRTVSNNSAKTKRF
jgi:hypothetical protein